MNSNFLSRIELFFWNFTIRTLSQSDMARSGVRKAYQITHNIEGAALGILLTVSGVAGLASGYLFYFLRMSLR
jgi:hypothetical protein